ncbi:unnamed protein product [Heterobilharzia americana]|nr:unnamed protein product [Heterobilharzia americana]CAH8492158.1 unnamed protein product [Heterobilharzia americana]
MFLNKEIMHYDGLDQSSVVNGNPKPQDVCSTTSFIIQANCRGIKEAIRDRPQADVSCSLWSNTNPSFSSTSIRPSLPRCGQLVSVNRPHNSASAQVPSDHYPSPSSLPSNLPSRLSVNSPTSLIHSSFRQQ